MAQQDTQGSIDPDRSLDISVITVHEVKAGHPDPKKSSSPLVTGYA